MIYFNTYNQSELNTISRCAQDIHIPHYDREELVNTDTINTVQSNIIHVIHC